MHEKPTLQHRSREKRDRIMGALDELLKRRSFATISVNDLAQQASVSPATLYQRFRNSDVMGSVLLALYFMRVEEWARRPRNSEPIPADAPLHAALKAVATDAWDQVAALRHVMHPAYLYSRQHPERTGPDWHRMEQLALGGFRALLQARAAQLPAQDLDEAAQVLCMLFNSLLLGPLLHAEDPRWKSRRGRDTFATTLATVAERYLVCPR